MSESTSPAAASTAAPLTAGVLEEEARRIESQRTREEVVLPDDLLPGVGAEPMSLTSAVRTSGMWTLGALGLGRVISAFDLAAFGVLAPDIQRTLDVSDAVLAAIGGAFGALFLLGSIPISSLADRYPRKILAAVSTAIWSVAVLGVAAAQNVLWFFVARMGTGLAESYALPVNGPLLADAYPIGARARIFAAYRGFEELGRVGGPVLAGTIASVVAGSNGWRWAFVCAAAAGVPAALAMTRIREPRRGRNEMRALFGDELADSRADLPISLSVAFERLRKIRTFHYLLLGLAALGFALFSVPLFLNLQLEDALGLSAWQRGVFGSVTTLPAIAALAIAAPRVDRLFRRSPPAAVVFGGSLVAAYGLLAVLAFFATNVVVFGVLWSFATAFATAAFTCLVAIVPSVTPYRLRSRGSALIGMYIFLFGGFFGAVLTGALSDLIGRRGAIAVVVIPSTLLGGALIAYGARFIRGDISRCTEELLEEKEEAERLAGGGGQPAIQVRNLDFAYDNVQVLFDINFDVQPGETLALLGTNGAGKSTLLRVISGLGVANRGAVRLNGRTITYADPEVRASIGIVQLMGGNAIFRGLSVDENLRMAGALIDRANLEDRVAALYRRFPALGERCRADASELSGGQQQMLAFAMALVHDPEVLIIDELTLGLAPIMVHEILEIVRDLQGRGMTLIVVEQSLNVALSIADRAVFMEKGQIRFDGAARELAERDDLARAVFLGTDAG
jgi:ABC-type branched-subunit amino acid transport system ATPase component/predicted MFS family arabinose efflux permease